MKRKTFLLITLLIGFNFLFPIKNKKIQASNVAINFNKFEGKSLVTIGDSITAQDGKAFGDSNIVAKGYQSIMKEILGFNNSINLGVSGSPVAYGTANGEGLSNIFKDYSLGDIDYIVIAAGTNDFRLDVPIGNENQISSGSKNRATFYGAYSKLVEDIKKNNPNAVIQLWTPIFRNNSGYDIYMKNKSGHKLEEYVEAIKKIAKYNGLTVCNMYMESGINSGNYKTFTYDGLHPNNKGYQQIGNKGAKCIQGI